MGRIAVSTVGGIENDHDRGTRWEGDKLILEVHKSLESNIQFNESLLNGPAIVKWT